MAELPKDMIYNYESKDGLSVTVTMTELVRCRECVMWDDSLVLNGKKKCLNMSFCTDGDFYCGWGSKE